MTINFDAIQVGDAIPAYHSRAHNANATRALCRSIRRF